MGRWIRLLRFSADGKPEPHYLPQDARGKVRVRIRRADTFLQRGISPLERNRRDQEKVGNRYGEYGWDLLEPESRRNEHGQLQVAAVLCRPAGDDAAL